MGFNHLVAAAYGVSTTMFILGTTSIFLRLYTRGFILKTFGWDDMMAIVLLVVNTFEQVIIIMFLKYGAGKNMSSITSYEIQQLQNWLLVQEVFYYFVHFIIKFAFLLFYLRLSPRSGFKKMVWATMVANVAVLIINWLLAFLQCVPFAAILHAALYPNAKCISQLVLFIVPSVLNIAVDIVILVLPIRTVWALHMSMRRKIGIIAVIGFGGAATFIAGMRVIVLFEFHYSPNFSYVLGKLIVMASLEVEFAILAVNLPSVKALWNKITNGSSNGSGAMGGYATDGHGTKGYKLSSMERSGRLGDTIKGTRGVVITSHAGRGSDSEEELFRQAGMGGAIKVTTDINMTRESKEKVDNLEREIGLQNAD